MTNAKKYLLVTGLSASLAVLGAAPAFAGDGGDSGQAATYDVRDSGDQGHRSSGLPEGGCVNLGGADAKGFAVGSPGLLSGNVLQAPISIPVNFCGNSINIGGLLNPDGGGGGGGGDIGGGGGGGNN